MKKVKTLSKRAPVVNSSSAAKRQTGRHKPRKGEPQTFLVPIDFSADSLRALTFARNLAWRFDAAITLVHVLDPIYAHGRFDSQRLRPLRADGLEHAKAKLARLAHVRPKRSAQEVTHHVVNAHLRREYIELLTSLAMEVRYGTDEWIFREGDPANRFFIILKGNVSIEIDAETGGTVSVRTLGPGDDLGWAWLFPPYYMHFSARTTTPLHAIFFYGTRLREECEQDHELGYELMKRVAEVVVHNLKATERRVFGAALRPEPGLSENHRVDLERAV